MKQKFMALLLALAMGAAVLPAAPVFAAEDGAGTAAAAETAPEKTETFAFADLPLLIQQNNLNYLIQGERIATIQATNYDQIQSDLIEQMNYTAGMEWLLYSSPATSFAAESLQQSYDAMRDALDDLKDRKTQKDNEDLILQLRYAQDTIVLAIESLYVDISEREAGLSALQRQLDALDRTMEEMELRYDQGQISALTLDQFKARRTAMLSQQQTLNMVVEVYKLQLEQAIGAPLSGAITLAALPDVSEKVLELMDLERDLAAAKDASYNLYAAKLTLNDARKDWVDNGGPIYGSGTGGYKVAQAHHKWVAAQYAYDSTVQDFESRFRILYLQVKDYVQVLQASRVALSLAEEEYAAAKAKFDLGNLSRNALSDAMDSVSSARDSVNTANRNLFSAWNNYRWAVDHGILN